MVTDLGIRVWTSLGTIFYLHRSPGVTLPESRSEARVGGEWEGGAWGLPEATLIRAEPAGGHRPLDTNLGAVGNHHWIGLTASEIY